MSASDAAPLPRLGEVFFDVRGNSRSMRLSWYADTDVAVFSIWQGGVCTGTFRLPMGDLSRMIEILQRGPDKRHERGSGRGPTVRRVRERGISEHGVSEHGVSEHGAGEHGAGQQGDHGYADSGYDPDYEADYNGQYDADYTVANASAHNGPASEADYRSGTHGPASAGEYGGGEYRSGEYRSGDYIPADYGPGEHGSGDYGSGDYGSGDYGSGDYGSGDYGSGDYIEPSYEDAGYRDGGSRAGGHRAGGHRAEPSGRDEYGRPDFEQAAYAPRPGYWHEDDRYQADATGQRSVRTDQAGYGQQRFVPPYVHPQPDSSESGYLDESEYRLPADPAAPSRHSADRYGRGQER
jgi:hypothetical protein